jgi:hypothetical protein
MTANSFDMSQGGDAGKVLFGLVCVVAIAWIYLLAEMINRCQKLQLEVW